MSIPRHLITKLEEFFRGVRRSSLRHLLKSNAAPSDLEVITIRALITDAEVSIEKLHRRFPERNLASKVTESQLLKIIEVHRALLSPVRYLPSEILQEIFLHYTDNSNPNATIATMPWRLGHISHRWRKIALSIPSLWDDIPKINILLEKPSRSYVRALICLIRRSCTPTLKFSIDGYPFPRKVPITPIIKEIILHSERIEQLRIEVNRVTMRLFQGFKGHLPNLRILRLYINTHEVSNLDVFETAPALQQVTIGGFYREASFMFLLPWSQITHFEEELPHQRAQARQLVPPASLHSLTYLHIYRFPCHCDESALRFPYLPITLSNLLTLKVVIYDHGYKNVDLLLESLTIPAVEVMKIRYMEPLIPHLVSMFSGSRGPSRLQKLSFRTIRLQPGELSALLNLTPHLVELDITVPPADDLLRLIYGEGGVMLVPMLQALYMDSPVLTTSTQTEHFDTLAQVRCDLGSRKDSKDGTMSSLVSGTRTWTTLHTLRLVFNSAESRDFSQKILNNWLSFFTPEESKAIDMISLCCDYCPSRDESFAENVFTCIEQYEITNKVLHVGVPLWMLAG